ncbi:class I SAM-dependent methyltransferase [Euzebyella saccharophila]|uniref:Class I SAM-dependent methyltransferase n=1 Tax=Euzebyella saccharophila TaxID=679664 RepID=A0ABV8JXK7_9FLAO|nr:class I SAM-dependent methyltransferase [Euzebyella saccharophila]
MTKDILGQALLDYQNENYSEDITTYSPTLDEEDVMPLPYLFRDYSQMPQLEKKALRLCKGKVLDIGAGSGSHSLYLQEKKVDVTALDNSSGAIETCRLRGVEKTILQPILEYSGETYDTLLLLMNGIGLAGRAANLNTFLKHLTSLLKPNGQILLDSSDIIYMFEEDEDGGVWVPNTGNYYGEVDFQMTYKEQKGKTFNWLYLDYKSLENAAELAGLSCEMVLEGEHYDYLARLWKDSSK